jgi:hypothetical protein
VVQRSFAAVCSGLKALSEDIRHLRLRPGQISVGHYIRIIMAGE